jgi:hypothetical protein
LKHTASGRFWERFEALPRATQAIARKCFAQLQADHSHPSLHFKPVLGGRFFTVRIGIRYRAIGAPSETGIHWFWIGTHSQYDQLLDQLL